jgi:dipeptidyl-peptidase-4
MSGFIHSLIPSPRRLLVGLGLIAATAGLCAYQPLTVQEIYSNNDFRGVVFQDISWSAKGRELIFRTIDPETKRPVYLAADPTSGRTRLLLDPAAIKAKFSTLTTLTRKEPEADETPDQFQFCPDGRRVLFLYKGDVYEYDLLNGSLTRRTYSPEPETAVRYSPDGQKIAYVRNFNLFVFLVDENRETPITTDGQKNLTYGTVDWVIEEELDLHDGYWWSPDSRFLAILRLDESHVPEYPLVDWIPQHPVLQLQKYPKAGDPNPVAALFCYSFPNQELHQLPVGGLPDQYIPRVTWTPNSRYLMVQLLNRRQNQLQLMRLMPEADEVKTLLEERDPCFVNVHDLFHICRSRPEFIWGSERDGFMHLYRYSLDGTLLNRLTQGEWAVTQLDDVDEAGGTVHFTATEKSPLERHLYRVAFTGGEIRRLTQEEGTHRTWISPDHAGFLDAWSTDRTPPVYRIGRLASFETAAVLRRPNDAAFAPLELRPWDYLTLKADDGATLHARLLKPYDFDPARRYPVVIYVYGGPHAQVVIQDWSWAYILWHHLLAQHGFIVFSLDNRGSGGRGKTWENAIYRNMGQRELQDQMAGVRYLSSLSYVDANRIAIWGWSYGGYMTCYAMARQPETFRAGVAVAPVTDWRDYDTIYTERYMSLPADNPAGYREASPVFQAGGIQGRLLLIHGTSDDNVHFQNSIQLIQTLVEHNVPFQFMAYPRMTHGISAKEARIHLFSTMLEFLEKNLRD